MMDEQDFLALVLKQITTHPDMVRVEKKKDDMGILLTVSAHQEDMGFIIGRDGANAQALRTLLRTHGKRRGVSISMKILEPKGAPRVPSSGGYAGDVDVGDRSL